MKFKKTYLLFAVALVFGAYIYFFEIKKAAEDEEKKELSQKVLSFDADKVRKMYFKNSFGEFELEKNAQNVWYLTKPMEAEADENTLNSLMSAIALEKFEKVAAEQGADLKPYGLSPVKLQLKLIFNNGDVKELLVGNNGALPGRVYVMSDGKRVLFANQNLRYQVDKSLKDLRDKRILKVGREQLNRVDIKSKGENFSLTRKDKKWFLGNQAADDESVMSFFNALESLRATDFPSEKAQNPNEVKKFGLDHPEVEITVYGQNGKLSDVISVSGKRQGSSFVKTQKSPSVYQVFANGTDALMKKKEDFRDKKSFLQFGRENLKTLSIKTDLADYSFVKKEGGWELEKSDPSKEVNQMQVMQLLNQLSALRAEEIFDKKANLPKPQGHVVLKDNQGSTLLDLKWGDKTPSGKSFYTVTQKSDKLFSVKDTLIQALPVQTLVIDKNTEATK